MNPIVFEAVRVSLVLGGLALISGSCIAWLNSWVKTRSPTNRLADQVNKVLPQIQCAKCGYAGCLPYAEAVVDGERLDLCPPGGSLTAQALASLLGRPVQEPAETMATNVVAVIAASKCVGCALCIEECPVDAILGAEGYAHDVLEKQCTGCELCIPACPVDCISLIPSVTHA